MQREPARHGGHGDRPGIDAGNGETLYSRLRSFLTALFWRRRFEDELDEELRFHLSAYAEDLMREGIPPAEAARRARAHFGSVERAKDASRLARGLRLADELNRACARGPAAREGAGGTRSGRRTSSPWPSAAGPARCSPW